MRAAARAVLGAALIFGFYATPGPAQDEPLGKSAAFGRLESASMVTVPAGTALRSRPSPNSARLVTITAETELQIIERKGDWVRTAYGDWTGWLAPLGEEASEVPLPSGLRASLMTLDTLPAERAARLFSARELLTTPNADFTSVGRWPLHTDVEDTELLELLDRVAQQVPALYAARFGLTPPPAVDPPPIVLFAREASYRAFTAENTEIGELAGGGHADSTMAAMFVSNDSTATDVAATLVHELTHLLNRDLFTKAPATWLEEGLANDLGITRIDAKGNLQLGGLGGTSTVMAQRTRRGTMVNATQSGGLAMWTQLMRDWRSRRSNLVPLDTLLDQPWAEFVDGSQRTSNYALSTFFVRYLLDQVEEETTQAFLAFLAEAAGGEASDGGALARALGTTPATLRREFEHWLTVQAVASR